MENNLEILTGKLHEEKSILLKNYATLISNYEEIRQAYKNIVNEYSEDTVEPVVLQCSQIYGYNKAGVITKWALDKLDGERIYLSGRYTKNELWVLNLTKLSIVPYTQFKLKAVVTTGSDSTSSIILEYDPESNISAYFRLTGTTADTTLHFDGTVPNNN